MRSVKELRQSLPNGRIMVLRLPCSDKKGSLYIPESSVSHEKKLKEKEAWLGQIVLFGLDSDAQERYGLKIGDVVWVANFEQHAATLDYVEGPCYNIEQDSILSDDVSATKEGKEALNAQDEYMKFIEVHGQETVSVN